MLGQKLEHSKLRIFDLLLGVGLAQVKLCVEQSFNWRGLASVCFILSEVGLKQVPVVVSRRVFSGNAVDGVPVRYNIMDELGVFTAE